MLAALQKRHDYAVVRVNAMGQSIHGEVAVHFERDYQRSVTFSHKYALSKPAF